MTVEDTPPRPELLSQGAAPSATRARIRRMGLHDLPFVVAAHQEHFPDGFFVDLGPRFLTRYYRTFLDAGPLTVALVAEVEGDRCGYLTGVLAGRQHRTQMLRHHGLGLAVAAALGMVARPGVAVRFVLTRSRRYAQALRRHRVEQSAPTLTAESPAVLSHVVVVEPERLAGVGSCLVQAFLREARDARCPTAALVTEAGARGAGPFYESLGWHVSGSTSVDGRALLRYTRSVEEDDFDHD